MNGGRRYEVDAGTEPRWDPTGHALYYRSGNRTMVIDVTGGAEPVIGRPRKLFDGDFLQWGTADYDVTRDGRFLMVRPATSAAGRALNVRLNWYDELLELF